MMQSLLCGRFSASHRCVQPLLDPYPDELLSLFTDYHDPARMGWGAMRVWNDDEIGARAEARDGVAVAGEARVWIRAFAEAEIVLVDAGQALLSSVLDAAKESSGTFSPLAPPHFAPIGDCGNDRGVDLR